MTAQFKVWWIPQIPMKPFEVSVPSYEEGVRLTDTLAAYDLFQYENNIKPDYANAGGVQILHPQEGWIDIDESTYEEIMEELGENSPA